MLKIFTSFFLLFFVENLVIPAFWGLYFTHYVTLVFVLSLFIYKNDNVKDIFILVALFGIIIEFLAGARVGSVAVPLIMTGLLYFWVCHFVDFKLKPSVANCFSIRYTTSLIPILFCAAYCFFVFSVLVGFSFTGFELTPVNIWNEIADKLFEFYLTVNLLISSVITSLLWKIIRR